MDRKRRRGRWVLGLVGVGGLLGMGWRLFPREPSLLGRATVIANTAPWHEGERFRSDLGVHWLSESDILFCRFEGPNHEERVSYRRNVRTGRDEKLAAFTEARNDFATEVVDDQRVSPDGRWFVCSDRWGECLLAEVNGAHHYTYPSADSANYRSLLWMPDGHHWLEGYVNGGSASRLILHDTEHPQSSVSIPIRSEREQELFGSLEAAVSLQEGISIVAPDHDTGGLDVAPAGFDTPIVLTISWVSLDASARVRAEFRVNVPGQIGHYRLRVSPQGNRIAWQVTALREDVGRRWMHRYLPFVREHLYRRTQVWVSRSDGSGMREIGSIIEQPGEEKAGELFLQWLPGGRRLSFEYKEVLYTVPAD